MVVGQRTENLIDIRKLYKSLVHAQNNVVQSRSGPGNGQQLQGLVGRPFWIWDRLGHKQADRVNKWIALRANRNRGINANNMQ